LGADDSRQITGNPKRRHLTSPGALPRACPPGLRFQIFPQHAVPRTAMDRGFLAESPGPGAPGWQFHTLLWVGQCSSPITHRWPWAAAVCACGVESATVHVHVHQEQSLASMPPRPGRLAVALGLLSTPFDVQVPASGSVPRREFYSVNALGPG